LSLCLKTRLLETLLKPLVKKERSVKMHLGKVERTHKDRRALPARPNNLSLRLVR